jgi:haloalkane dehalogenase
MNTGVPTGRGEMIDAWWMFREYIAGTTDPSISTVVRALGDMAAFHERAEQPEPWVTPVEQGEAGLDLSPEVMAAYDAPFHTPEAKAGARQWSSLVPTDPDMEGADVGMQTVEALGDWEKPAFVLYSDRDPITHGARDGLRELIPSAGAQPDVWIEGAGHFLQEEAGERVAEEIVAFVDRT